MLLPLSKEQKQQIENYLRGYSINRKLLRMDRYHREFMGGGETDALGSPDREILNEVPLARAKMFEVRHFILELENSDEKLFLYYHYVKGESVERCSELLGISRRSGFRLKNKALSLAFFRLFPHEKIIYESS